MDSSSIEGAALYAVAREEGARAWAGGRWVVSDLAGLALGARRLPLTGELVACLVRRCEVEVFPHRVFCDGHRGIVRKEVLRALELAYEGRDLYRWRMARERAISALPERLRPEAVALGSTSSS